MLANPDIGVTQIVHRLGVSPATLYRYSPAARTANLPDLWERRANPGIGCLDGLTDRRDLHHDERPDIMGLADQTAGSSSANEIRLAAAAGCEERRRHSRLADVIDLKVAVGQGGP